VDSQHIQRLLWLCNTAQSGSQIQLPNKVLAFRQFDQIIVAAEEPLIRDVSYSYNLPIPGQCSIPEIGAVFSARLGSLPAERRPNFERQVFLDPSVLPSILTLRPKKPGDRLGGSGCRKVKKLLIDRKIPSAQRAFLPMVVAGSHVIWIPGFRPARAYEAGLESNTCIILDFIKDLE
jgi:tRNA(Ile)-lysidine synthase